MDENQSLGIWKYYDTKFGNFIRNYFTLVAIILSGFGLFLGLLRYSDEVHDIINPIKFIGYGLIFLNFYTVMSSLLLIIRIKNPFKNLDKREILVGKLGGSWYSIHSKFVEYYFFIFVQLVIANLAVLVTYYPNWKIFDLFEYLETSPDKCFIPIFIIIVFSIVIVFLGYCCGEFVEQKQKYYRIFQILLLVLSIIAGFFQFEIIEPHSEQTVSGYTLSGELGLFIMIGAILIYWITIQTGYYIGKTRQELGSKTSINSSEKVIPKF